MIKQLDIKAVIDNNKFQYGLKKIGLSNFEIIGILTKIINQLLGEMGAPNVHLKKRLDGGVTGKPEEDAK